VTVTAAAGGGGQVVRDRAAATAVFGHKQTARFRTLRYDQRLQGRNARVMAMTADVIRSGPVRASAPPNNLQLLKGAGGAPMDSPEDLVTGLLDVPLPSGWSDDGSVEFVIDHTGPFTLRALTPHRQVA
jgi:hypothetical protein